MKDYQFKVGDKGKTRDGKKEYEVLAITDRVDRGLVVVVKYPDDEEHFIGTRHPNGRYCLSRPNFEDLLPPVHAVYMNVYGNYKNGYTYYFPSEQEARRAAGPTAIAIAVPVEIPG